MAITAETYVQTRTALPGQAASGLLRAIAYAVVLGSLLFNPFLCMINTRFTPVFENHIVAVEMLIIGTTLLGAIDRRAGIYLFFGVFISYMIFLFAMRGQADPKAVRDILIPVVFFALGSRLGDLKVADRLALATALIVLAFALFEYFMLETYLDWFNVLGYYLSKGSVRLEEVFGITRGLFISGIRPEPRTILPFLGQHRVASVLLEPVSMGNLGVILYAWGLFRRGYGGRWILLPVALALVTLADARFGLMTCILTTLLFPFLKILPRLFWSVMPFILLALIAAFGMATETSGGPNDVMGRIQVTAHLLTQLNVAVVLGVETTNQFTADSGLAYTLTKFGIVGFVGLWATLVFLPVRDARGWAFRAMAIIYLLLLMIISNSFYSIKTDALLWFLIGTASTAAIPTVRSWWQPRKAD